MTIEDRKIYEEIDNIQYAEPDIGELLTREDEAGLFNDGYK
jgi:hypothetical protein